LDTEARERLGLIVAKRCTLPDGAVVAFSYSQLGSPGLFLVVNDAGARLALEFIRAAATQARAFIAANAEAVDRLCAEIQALFP
jgi:hypothetical protein